MDKIKKFPKFTFNYILPFSLGLITGLFFKDSIILGHKKKLSMAVYEYYNNQGEVIPNIMHRVIPELKGLEKRMEKKENKSV